MVLEGVPQRGKRGKRGNRKRMRISIRWMECEEQNNDCDRSSEYDFGEGQKSGKGKKDDNNIGIDG